MTTTAITRPSSPSVVSASIDFSTNGAWSKTTVSSAPAAAPARAAGRGSRARSRPRCRPASAITAMPRLSVPLVRVNEVGGASCCSTVATSPSRTGAPLAGAADGRRAQLVQVADRVPTWTGRRPVPVGHGAGRHRHPVGLQRRADRGRAATPAAASFAGSGVIDHALVPGAGHLDVAYPVDRLPARAPPCRCSLSAQRRSSAAAGRGQHHRREVVGAAGEHLGSTLVRQLRVDPAERGLHLVDRVVEVGAERELAPGWWRSPPGRRGDLLHPGDALKAFSIGSATCASTTSGAAPG